MATLVLTAVGSLVGGPIGGAIGAALGQQVDRAWLSSGRTNEGPRLKQLEVQTSSYGTAIPAVFGAMRVAGTVIWATDLIENSHKHGGGKGQPSAVEYSYSVSLAVALSSRPVARVGRVWADGNLLRGEDGALKVEAQFRFHDGHHDQLPDPLLASVEAAGQCPAYRGLAFAVFEDLQLATFGNRIPQLTFEIFEREGPVPLADIATSIVDISGECSAAVQGFALAGENGRAALASLIETMPVTMRADGYKLELFDWTDNEDPSDVMLLASEGSHPLDPAQNLLVSSNDVPGVLALRHYDPARDYQIGVQRSQRNAGGQGEKQIDIPAVLSADVARSLADAQLLQAQRARKGWAGHIAIGAQRIRPGDWLTIASGRKFRIDAIEHGRSAMRIEASDGLSAVPSVVHASSGRAIGAPDLAIGETRLMLADLPAIGSDPEKPQIALFAAGSEPGWRRAALSVRQGSSLIDMGMTASPATMGHAENALGLHSEFLIDDENNIIVELLHSGMALPAATGSPLHAAAPLCLLGGEYLRYGEAAALGGNRYRLSRLLRGCHGTEDAIALHETGESFLLIEAACAKAIDAAWVQKGQVLQMEAQGFADGEPSATECLILARAITPLPPIHLAAHFLPDGGIDLCWHWRSRIDLGWQDGIEQPCAEILPRFNLRLRHGSWTVAEWIVEGTDFQIASVAFAAFELAGETVQFDIRQIGRFAISEPASVWIEVQS